MNNKVVKKKKINVRMILIYIISFLVVIGIISIFVLGRTQTFKQNEIIKIDNDISKVNISVGKVKRGLKLESSIAGSQTDTFTKIKLTIENKNNMPTLLSTFITFELHNKHNKKIADCSNLSFLLKDESDFIKDVNPNEKTSGYIYCKTDSLDGKKLLISALTGIDKKKSDQGIIKGTGFDRYYVKLK